MTATATDQIRTLTSSTFDPLVLTGNGPIVVEFMSYGCAHCRAIEPALQEVTRMVKPRETVYRVNVAVEPDLASNYEIASTPTFVMFRDGEELGRIAGPDPNVPSLLSALTEVFE